MFCLQKKAVNHSRYRPLSSHAPFFANNFPRGPLEQFLLLRELPCELMSMVGFCRRGGSRVGLREVDA